MKTSTVLMAVGFAVSSFHAGAQDEKGPESFDIGAPSDSLALVTGNDYAPFADRDLENGGLATDLVTHALNSAGIDYTVTYDQWNRGRVMTLYAKYDATFPYAKTLERQQLFYFSKPLYESPIYWYTRSGDELAEYTADALDGMTTCKPDGFYLSDIQEYLIGGRLDLVLAPSLQECLQRLAAGEVDIVSGARLIVRSTIAQSPELRADAFHGAKSGSNLTFHVMVSKSHPFGEQIITMIDESLDDLGPEETENIRARHMQSFRQRSAIEGS